MRRRDEVLVGVVTLVAFATLIAGMFWLARGGLSSGYPLYAKFEWGAGLKQGQPVLFSGVNVGYVDQVNLLENGGLVTTLRIYKKQRVPKGTVAAIEPNGIFGDMQIALHAPGPTGEWATAGDTIVSRKGGAQIADLLAKFDSVEATVLKLVNSMHKELVDNGGVESLRKTANAAQAMFVKLDSIASIQSGEFTKTQESLRKAASAVDSAVIDSTLKHFRDIATNVSTLSDSLKMTTARINSIADKIEHGNGTAAKLVNDSSLYQDGRNAVHQLDSLLADVKANPKKYVSFKICLFRCKDKVETPPPKKP